MSMPPVDKSNCSAMLRSVTLAAILSACTVDPRRGFYGFESLAFCTAGCDSPSRGLARRAAEPQPDGHVTRPKCTRMSPTSYCSRRTVTKLETQRTAHTDRTLKVPHIYESTTDTRAQSQRADQDASARTTLGQSENNRGAFGGCCQRFANEHWSVG